eukprot:UN3245
MHALDTDDAATKARCSSSGAPQSAHALDTKVTAESCSTAERDLVEHVGSELRRGKLRLASLRMRMVMTRSVPYVAREHIRTSGPTKAFSFKVCVSLLRNWIHERDDEFGGGGTHTTGPSACGQRTGASL